MHELSETASSDCAEEEEEEEFRLTSRSAFLNASALSELLRDLKEEEIVVREETVGENDATDSARESGRVMILDASERLLERLEECIDA